MLHLDRFYEAQHPRLQLAVGYSKTIVLSLVLGPRVNFETLLVDIWSLGIKEDAPTRRAVTAGTFKQASRAGNNLLVLISNGLSARPDRLPILSVPNDICKLKRLES